MIARLIFCATVTTRGTRVFRWGAGRVFPMIASNIPVFGKELWTVDVKLADSQGTLLPGGHYITQSFLATRTDLGIRNPVAFAKKYAASGKFSIENRQTLRV